MTKIDNALALINTFSTGDTPAWAPPCPPWPSKASR
mgnify:CR=1 FL=1